MKKQTHNLFVAYLFWLFGFFGLHRFYFGRRLSGIIWAFTFGLLFIGWIVDLFLIPSMERDTRGIYRTGLVDYSVAWILWLFLGLLGIHRFYMGKVGTGIIYLLTGGLIGIGWIYDLLTLNEQIHEQNTRRS